MADVVALAQDFWDLAMDDPSFAATLRSDRVEMIKAVVAGTNVGDVINGSKNGSQYTIRIGFTLQDRLTAIKMAVNGLDRNRRPSRNQQVWFSC